MKSIIALTFSLFALTASADFFTEDLHMYPDILCVKDIGRNQILQVYIGGSKETIGQRLFIFKNNLSTGKSSLINTTPVHAKDGNILGSFFYDNDKTNVINIEKSESELTGLGSIHSKAEAMLKLKANEGSVRITDLDCTKRNPLMIWEVKFNRIQATFNQ